MIIKKIFGKINFVFGLLFLIWSLVWFFPVMKIAVIFPLILLAIVPPYKGTFKDWKSKIPKKISNVAYFLYFILIFWAASTFYLLSTIK